MSNQDSCFNLPLGHGGDRKSFPTALSYYWDEDGRTDTLREIVMRQIMNSIIDKPEWNRKVFDDVITTKWRQEVAASGKDVSSKMMDWVIDELRWKADYLAQTGMIMSLDSGVVISDTAISPKLQQELQDAVAPLELLEKDFHPNSDEKVIDLVHPSLFPVIYDRTRVLCDHLLGLDECLDYAGEGELLPSQPTSTSPGYSKRFQWMPCDVELTNDGGCRIVSYINNLHPKQYRPLYHVIEKIITRAIPLWNLTLSNSENQNHRIVYDEVEYNPPYSPANGDYEEWENTRQTVQPEPTEPFDPSIIAPSETVNLHKDFPTSGLQIIVKLATIELTPQKPNYDGGSWHIEGALNEHIAATAIYYYSSSNITPSTLAFRQRAHTRSINEMNYTQNEFSFLQEVFGFGPDVQGYTPSNVTQELGGLSTPEGRLLTFPNTLQHRVSPFSLADKSKPGHRKILAFFLVDPHFRVISSANVPPQRKDWQSEKREAIAGSLASLPRELADMVMREVDVHHVTMQEACGFRLELMEERTARSISDNEDFETGDFGLCEH